MIKKLAGVGVAAAIIVALASHYGLVPGARVREAAVPQQFALPSDAPAAPETTTVAQAVLPSSRPASLHQPVVRFNVWAWNAQMGLFFANGGPTTTQGSLMDKHGVSVAFTRQNDSEVTKPEQLKLATALANGAANPTEGVHYTIIMGDGAAQYIASVNKLTSKLGDDYRAEIIGAVGYSRGEDGWWGPQEWVDNHEAMKGGATAGYLRDGDWNIAQYKLANDKIKNNPDPTKWDPDAMNWFAADDYLKAVEMYNSGYCEDRAVVRNGKLTNEPKHHTCVEGVVTWTPGDVNIVHGKGGLVRLLSTAENVYQMPAVVIGIHKWNVTHAKQTQEMLAAAFEGADQLKHYEPALSKAAQISTNIYSEQNAAYWAKYYKGTKEKDKTTGAMVPLGGSTVMNLGDNLLLFGLLEGSGGLENSLFNATYTGFGNIVVQQYPDLFPRFPKVTDAVNLSFLRALAASAGPVREDEVEVQKFENSGPIAAESVVAKRNWNITFDTGKATFTPAAEATLQELYNQLLVGAALQVEIDGHTDNIGSPDSNRALSEARAFAVKAWLEQKAKTLFPENRITVRAFGDSMPLVPNATPEGRAQNRRVTVVLGTKS